MLDVIVIGAGIVGCAVARELSKRKLDILVLEKGFDVASGATKANSGIVHAGYDALPGTKKAVMNVRGQRMFDKLSKELGFPFSRCGSLVLGFGENDRRELEELNRRGRINGLSDIAILGREEILALEPGVGDSVTDALLAPSGGVVSPYEMCIALADNAALNGVKFALATVVTGISQDGDGYRVQTNNGEYLAKVVVNAAGVHSGEISEMAGGEKNAIQPRRGEYCLLDQEEGGLVSRVLFQVPGKMGKGVLVAPTADGNVLIGPTSKDIDDGDDTSTTREGLAEALEKASRSLKRLPRNKIITSFAGVRAHHKSDDFVIEESGKGFVNLMGIESPGLSAAPAIGEAAAEIVCGILQPEENSEFCPNLEPFPKFRESSWEERQRLIEKDPDFGNVICRCEKVTKAEILNALRNPIGAVSLDAVKRRTRTGMGRCQSGFCMMKLVGIVSEELGKSPLEATKHGGGSWILSGPIKEALL
ncbi:MAG: NAD(P)/FAD-dependent oxidoreductase [Clostridiales bacterium]|nr:NAD(P)/FAD-dependent oxidoreductase [Clostridiales bacterium]